LCTNKIIVHGLFHPFSDAVVARHTENRIQPQFLSVEFKLETVAHLDFFIADDLHLDDSPFEALGLFSQDYQHTWMWASRSFTSWALQFVPEILQLDHQTSRWLSLFPRFPSIRAENLGALLLKTAPTP